VDTEKTRLTSESTKIGRVRPASDDPLIGARIRNIKLVARLGQGGMGTVYQGVDEALQRRVAVKVLNEEHRLDQTAQTRFTREAQLLSKLNHPNICQIFDYVNEQDNEYLVLEFIEGGTLRSLLEEHRDKKQKLDIALQLSTVLVSAHAHGVIHRDLKPGNVMVTSTGVVKVLDFGLGRSLEEENRSTILRQSDKPITELGSTERTSLGTVMGTLGYLSPEQARGEIAGQASDIYSMGLLLQEMFTGERPFDPSKSPSELLTAAMEGKSMPVVGLSADLRGLIESMKASEPQNRPSATEVLARLRLIQTKPRRLALKCGIAAGVLLTILGTLKYTIDLSHERRLALQAQQEAVAARNHAERLMGFMLDDLYRSLEPLGQLGLLKQVAQEGVDYYQPKSGKGVDPQDLEFHLLALRNMGKVLLDQGELDQALSAFHIAQDMADKRLQVAPDERMTRFYLAESFTGIGQALVNQDRMEEAITALTTAVEVNAALVQEEPEDNLYREGLTASYSALCRYYVFTGELKQAFPVAHKALQSAQMLHDRWPSDPRYTSQLVIRYAALGQVVHRLGRIKEALTYLEKAIEMGEQQRRMDPMNVPYLRDLRDCWSEKGRVLQDLGEDEQANTALLTSVDLGRQLADSDPSNSENKYWLSAIYDFLGESYLALGKVDAAHDAFVQSLAIMESLVVLDESNVYFQADLAFSLVQVGRAQSLLGKRRSAVQEWKRAVAIMEPLKDSKTQTFQDTYARALLYLGRVDEARPVVDAMLATGAPLDDELVRLCTEHGLDTGEAP